MAAKRFKAGLLALFVGLFVAANSTIASLGGPFKLINQDGQVITDADLHGSPVLLYFGFTYCPDVCPIDLHKLTIAADILEKDHDIIITPVFVTIDPERDTPDILREYAASFHPRLIGLTGSAQAVAAMADQYAVYYEKAGDGPDYTMDHSTVVFLLDSHGRYAAHFGRKKSAEQIAAASAQVLKQ